MRGRSRLVQRLVLLALGAGAAAAAADAGPLPKLAVSLPAGVRAADVERLLSACGAEGVSVVLPAVDARIGGTGDDEVPPAPPVELPARAFLRVRLAVAPLAASGREREAAIERQAAAIVARLGLERPEVAGLVIESDAPPDLSDIRQFALATLIVKARGARPDLAVAIELPDLAARQRLLAYVDAVILSLAEMAAMRATGLEAPTGGRPVTLRVPVEGADDRTAGSRALLDLLTRGETAASTLWFELPGLSALGGLCATTQFLARSLDAGAEMTPAERAPAAVLVDGRPAARAVAFVGSRSADIAVLLRADGSRQSPRTLALAAAAGGSRPQIACFDAIDGRTLDAGPAAVPGCRATAEYVLFSARVAASGDRLFESVSVTARAALRVDEIIARWQAAREAERAQLDNYSVPCFLVLHFELTTVSMAFDIALELEQYWDRSGVNDWVQTQLRVNGVKLGKGQAFPLPQLEPDKVVTKPLELRLDDKYRYELLGTETVDGRVCYVVAIAPAEPSDRLYTGKVWIDGVDFRQVRVVLEQRDAKNNVTAHIETQQFARVRDQQGREFTLLRAIDAEDQVNIAGRSVTLEKRYRFGLYAVNRPDFPARLAAARAGRDPMFRDTEDGLRALVRKGDDLVVDQAPGKVIRAGLGGVLYDGGRSYPVPLAGISWVDFDFRRTGAQFSSFFAGPLFMASLSKQVNRSFRWGVDLSLNALPNTFAEYEGDQELTGERIRNFQQWAGAILVWQASSSLVFNTQVDVYHDLYQATGETDPAYRVPASGVTLANYGEAKYARKGFSAIAAVEHGTRIGWRAYGYPDDPTEPALDNWTRYSIEVSQHLYAGRLARGGVSAKYFGGRSLDRFSRYTPSFFERPTITGLPSGAGAYDEVTTIGGYYGFNVLDLAKLQGAYAHAWTRNKGEGDRWKPFDGLSVSLGVAGPFGTFVQGIVNVALRGDLDRYNSRWGVYMVALKPWK